MSVAMGMRRIRPWGWAGVAVAALSLAAPLVPTRAAAAEAAAPPEARFTTRARTGVYRWTTEFCFLFVCEKPPHARRFTRYTTAFDVTIPNELVGAGAWVEGMPFSVVATGGRANGTVDAAQAPGRSYRARSARFQDRSRRMTLSVGADAYTKQVKFRRTATSGGFPDLLDSASAEVVLGQFSRAYQFTLARSGGSATGTSTGVPLGTALSDPGTAFLAE